MMHECFSCWDLKGGRVGMRSWDAIAGVENLWGSWRHTSEWIFRAACWSLCVFCVFFSKSFNMRWGGCDTYRKQFFFFGGIRKQNKIKWGSQFCLETVYRLTKWELIKEDSRTQYFFCLGLYVAACLSSTCYYTNRTHFGNACLWLLGCAGAACGPDRA